MHRRVHGVRPLEEPEIGEAGAEGGRDLLRDLPAVARGQRTHRARAQAALLVERHRRAEQMRSVAGADLDLVAVHGLEHEVGHHPPGRALALGHQPAQAPAAGAERGRSGVPR